MNYRHIYHAGGFADVFKHSILVHLLLSLAIKDKGYCYIDTHSGIGLYDLQREEAQRSPEFLNGIKVLNQLKNVPAELKPYLSIIQNQQRGEDLRFYPGSPLIATKLVRQQDMLILNEQHPKDFKTLKTCFQNKNNTHCHQRDAYEFLPAILPPLLSRALILIDPAYEIPNEYEKLLEMLIKATTRFSSGIYAIWYPIKSHSPHIFLKKCAKQGFSNPLVAELILSDDRSGESGMIGCGMLILNPPWKIEEKLTVINQFLWESFSFHHQGYHRLFSV